jgi:hypothetical protein
MYQTARCLPGLQACASASVAGFNVPATTTASKRVVPLPPYAESTAETEACPTNSAGGRSA